MTTGKQLTDFEHQCLAALITEYGIGHIITTAVNIYQNEAEDEDPDYDDQGNLKPGVDH